MGVFVLTVERKVVISKSSSGLKKLIVMMKVLAIFCVFIVLLNEMDAVPQSDDNNYFKERAEQKKTEESDKKGSDAKKGDENDEAENNKEKDDDKKEKDGTDEKKSVENPVSDRRCSMFRK